jgi:hypothetical protein
MYKTIQYKSFLYLGFLFFLGGILFYEIARPVNSTLFENYYHTFTNFSFYPIFVNHFTGSLPSLVHSLSFLLITSSFYKHWSNYYLIGISWVIIGIGNEILQYHKLIGGTFDYFDVLYSIIGILIGFVIIYQTKRKEIK